MNPSLYQINTKAFLSQLGTHATIDDIPNSFLDSLAAKGFDWVWLLGVWRIGPTGAEISREHRSWHEEYRVALPDLTLDDICGSPFAVCEHTVDPSLGGDSALARFRERLEQRGLQLLLDFVPNHIGFDHRWVQERPDFLMHGSLEDLERSPDCWTRLKDGSIVAFGRDPHFPGWPDTLQLNFFNPQLRAAMIGELKAVASRCSGVRCDMAMLLEPEVFKRTWAGRPESKEPLHESFWPEAISSVRNDNPEFLFLAEVYWDYEARLQAHGFDYTYDKTLYDRLLHSQPQGVFAHLTAPSSYQARMAHFLENHDEQRISSKLSFDQHRAAAVISFFAPGLRFVHHGQCEGNRVRIPVHLRRGPDEVADERVVELYETIMPLMNSTLGKHGEWSLLHPKQAWGGNPTHTNFIAYHLRHESEELLIAVNYADHQGQCFVPLAEETFRGERLTLQDRLSPDCYVREARDIRDRGLYLDTPPFTTHIFTLTWS